MVNICCHEKYQGTGSFGHMHNVFLHCIDTSTLALPFQYHLSHAHRMLSADLEFKIADNPGRDGTLAVDAMLTVLRDVLRERFDLNMEDSWILELDSTTPLKFSRHVIVRIPGAAFADNSHVGVVVKQVCLRAWGHQVGLKESSVGNTCGLNSLTGFNQITRNENLIFKKADAHGGETLVIDYGVYTRNRAFRLHLSSKAGSDSRLVATGRFGGHGLTAEQMFMAALVCNVPPEARLLRCSLDADSGRTCADTAAKQQSATRVKSGQAPFAAVFPRFGPSDNPKVDAFIESVCVEGGIQGLIRSWFDIGTTEDCTTASVRLYNIRRNRYCGNVGRQHKSNGIFYVVDMQQGVWYQKCYDPDCRDYRSPVMPLPREVLLNSSAALAVGQDGGGQKPEIEDTRWGDAAEVATWDEAALEALMGWEKA